MIRLSAADAKKLNLPRGGTVRQIIKAVERKTATVGSFLGWRLVPTFSSIKLGPEDKVQVGIMSFLRAELVPDAVAFHAANESKRSKMWWALLYMLGTWRGFPDIIILHRGRAYFIEVKSESGALTIDQENFLEWAKASGFPCVVARSIGPVGDFLTEHGLRVTKKAA